MAMLADVEVFEEEEADEDDVPEWMKLLQGPKSQTPESSAQKPDADQKGQQEEAPWNSAPEEEEEEAEVPAPLTPIAAPSTPPGGRAAVLQDGLAEHRDSDARIGQLLGLVFADKASVAYDQLEHQIEDYVRQRCEVCAFPRRLVLLRGPPGVGSTEWAMQSLQKEMPSHLSTFSRQLLSVQLAHVCSRTDFAAQLRNGKWEATSSPSVGGAEEEASRALNEARVRLTMELGLEPLYIDGSHASLWELQPYVALADRMGYVVSVVSSGEVNPRWQDVDYLLSRQSQLGRPALESMLHNFEDLPEGSDPRAAILAAERPASGGEDSSAPNMVPPTALLYKLERLLLEGTELLRYVPPDGDGWGVNGELSGEWQHFREKADGSCSYDDRMTWLARAPDSEGSWRVAELALLADLRGQASKLPQANLPSAVSHPGLFLQDEEPAQTHSTRAPAARPPPAASSAARRWEKTAVAANPQQKRLASPAVSAAVPVSRQERLRQRMREKREAEQESSCPQCSNVFMDDSFFCRHCGQKREEGGAPPANKRARGSVMPKIEYDDAKPMDTTEEPPPAHHVAKAAPGEPTEDEEVSASTFLAAVKARLLEWGKVEQYHEFVLALSGSVDARKAVKILRGHNDLLGVFRRKFAPKADLSKIKAELEEDDDDAPRPPAFPPRGHAASAVKQEASAAAWARPGAVKQELGSNTPKPPPFAPPRRVKAEVKGEVKSEAAFVKPRPPTYGPNARRAPVSLFENDSEEELEVVDEASIASSVRRGRDECIALLAKTIFKRERASGAGARQRLAMVHYASRVAAKPRFPRELFILRGLPGIGKTEYALQQLADLTGFDHSEKLSARLTHVCAADDFFESFKGDMPVYKFEPHRLDSAYSRNEVRAMLAMEAGIHPLFVDCPNLRLWEMRPYLLLAEKLGYVVTVVQPQDICDKSEDLEFVAAANNTAKAVPAEMLSAMLQAFEHSPDGEDPLEAIRSAKRPHGPRAVEVEVARAPASSSSRGPSLMQVKAEFLAQKAARGQQPQARPTTAAWQPRQWSQR